MTNTDRLAAHVVAENRRRVGYGYEDHNAERAWAKMNLPRTRAAFQQVVASVRSSGWVATAEAVAELLPADQSLRAKWLKPAKKSRAGNVRCCAMCGAPAISRASFGWACGNHYDEMS